MIKLKNKTGYSNVAPQYYRQARQRTSRSERTYGIFRDTIFDIRIFLKWPPVGSANPLSHYGFHILHNSLEL
jgi:hypothetical protein